MPPANPKTKPDGTDLTTEDVAIYLATIPVVWLRGIGAKLLDNPVASYAQLVSEAQNELKFLEGRE